MITINLNDEVRTDVTPKITVFTKSSWDSDFVKNDRMMVQEASWAHSPAVSTAMLQYRFGSVRLPGKSRAETIPQMTARGYFVLIRYSMPFKPSIWWLGYADAAILVGRFAGKSGVQEIPCYGFERAMQYAEIQTIVHENPDDEADIAWLRKNGNSTFNPSIPGNRTNEPVVVGTHFDRELKSHIFANPASDEPQFWSTRDIFRHLIQFHLPTNDFGISKIPFLPHDDADDLPAWDRPTINTNGMSLHGALSELLTGERMMGWTLEPEVTLNLINDSPSVSAIYIRPFTRITETLTLPSIGTLPANTRTINWQSDEDELTDSEVQTDDSDSVDQVVIRGPREIAIGSFTVGNVWTNAWDTDLEDEYKTGYSNELIWATKELYEKRALNDQFRSLPKYADVFSRYRIKDDWNGQVQGEDLFVKADPDDPPYIPYLGVAELLDEMPLFRGVDYSGPVDSVDESKGRQPLPLLAFIRSPYNNLVWFPLQDFHAAFGTPAIQAPNKLDYEVNIKADNHPGAGFRLSFSGAPQHAFESDFVGNEADPEQINSKIWGKYRDEDLVITTAMRGDRRPQFAIPATAPGDLIRRRTITLEHPGLQHVQIAKDTIVGIDFDNDTVKSAGGTLRNTLPLLEALCTIAAKFLIEPRRMVQVTTGRMLNDVAPGNVIKTHNGETVDAVIREVRISTPVVEGDAAPPAIMSISATTHRSDIASLVGRVPGGQGSASY